MPGAQKKKKTYNTAGARQINIKNFLQETIVETTTQREADKRKKPGTSPRNRKACHSISIALLQSIVEPDKTDVATVCAIIPR
jgi:hypothetical protein